VKRSAIHVFLTLLVSSLTACAVVKTDVAEVDSTLQLADAPTIETSIGSVPIPTPDNRFPLARPLTKEEVDNLDKSARQLLLRDRKEAGSDPHFENSILGPRLVPRTPASLTLNWVDVITMPVGQPLAGYLDIAAIAKGKKEHDYLLLLYVDGQQTAFELDGHLAPAHLLRLPAWETQAFSFRLPQSLPAGRHELIFLVNDDPYNIYATQGVLEKHRQGGKVTFSTAAERSFPKPTAIRHYVTVGKGNEAAWVKTNWIAELFEPQNTDLLGSPLLLSLADDETDPLIQKEPALVSGSDDPLYAFIHTLFSLPGGLTDTTASLVAILDEQQVRINGQKALFFRVEASQHYRIPLRIEWPARVRDGKVHSLYVGVAFGVGKDWRGDQEEWAKLFNWAYFADPIMVVPDRTLIEYIWQSAE
jgi:hypothetical protein